MGLQYKGFGYWVDPRTNKVTHKTEGDNLVPVAPDVETEMAPGDNEAAMANKVLPGVGGEDIKAKVIPGSGVGPCP